MFLSINKFFVLCGMVIILNCINLIILFDFLIFINMLDKGFFKKLLFFKYICEEKNWKL